MSAWYLGAKGGTFKRVHREGCRYATMPYNWAGDRSVAELLSAMQESGSVFWHRGCRLCALDLDIVLIVARAERMARVIEEHLADSRV